MKFSLLAYFHDGGFYGYQVGQATVISESKRKAMARDLGQHLRDVQLGIPMVATARVWGAAAKVQSWENLYGKPYFTNPETLVLS